MGRPIASRDDRGFTTVFVALLLLAILFVMAYLIDVTGILLRKQELQTMAELGSAAGGRVVTEKIAELADERVRRGEILPPAEGDADAREHPERFLTPEDRTLLQTDPSIIDSVKSVALDIAGRNRPKAISESAAIMTTTYPLKLNDCADASKKTVDIKVVVEYDRPFILGKLAAEAGKGDTMKIKEEGLYRVNLCP